MLVKALDSNLEQVGKFPAFTQNSWLGGFHFEWFLPRNSSEQRDRTLSVVFKGVTMV